jgi:hypothetical protein
MNIYIVFELQIKPHGSNISGIRKTALETAW